jgi:membrane protein required for colicin V production
LSGVDIALCVFILIGAYSGYKEGFLMELFSLVGILLGILGGFKLLGWAMVVLGGQFNVDQDVLPYVAFAVVFVVIIVAVKLLGNLMKLSIDKSFLGKVDQLAGLVLGVVKTIFVLSVLLWLADSFHMNMPKRWTDNAWLLGKVAGFAPQLTSWISEFFPIFKDVF